MIASENMILYSAELLDMKLSRTRAEPICDMKLWSITDLITFGSTRTWFQ